MKRTLILFWIAVSFWPLAAHSYETADYDKFYDRAESICHRALHAIGIDDCDSEMSRCMTMLFSCARDTASCTDKVHGTRVVSCTLTPFSHDGLNGACDETDALRDARWNQSCQPLPGEKYATPGCNNGVVEISEACDDGGVKPDKCSDTCEPLFAGVGGNGGVTIRNGTDFGPISGFVGSGGTGGIGSDPGPLSEDPPPVAGGDGGATAPAPAPAPAHGEPSGTAADSAAVPQPASSGSNGTVQETATTNGTAPASSATGEATASAGGCAIDPAQPLEGADFSWIALFILAAILPRYRGNS